jgi:Zn-dependent protease
LGYFPVDYGKTAARFIFANKLTISPGCAILRKAMIILENLKTTRRYRLFSLFGVDWLATPYAWASLFLHVLFGVLIATALDGKAGLSSLFWTGTAYGLLLYLASILHILGHLVSSRLAGGPLDTILFTATFPMTLYEESLARQASLSKWVHIGRAVGGPLIHLLIGLVLLALYRLDPSRFLAFFILVNLIVGVWVLFPFPALDGGVIWGELLGLKKYKKRRKSPKMKF